MGGHNENVPEENNFFQVGDVNDHNPVSNFDGEQFHDNVPAPEMEQSNVQNINKQTSLFLRRMQMLTNLFLKRMKIQTSLYLLLTSLRPEKNQAMTITRSRT